MFFFTCSTLYSINRTEEMKWKLLSIIGFFLCITQLHVTDAQECIPPCLNGGTCEFEDGSTNTTCRCANLFYGKKCQYRNSCVLFQICQNGGTCVLIGGKIECQCPDGFHGDLCQSTDPCISSPCSEPTRCEMQWPDSYQCVCGNGYYGENCTEYNACHDEPCQNGGTCLHRGNWSYECNCSSGETGYHGDNCEVRDMCSMGHCDDTTSRCESDEDGYRCVCHPGFYGPECSSYDICLTDPCRNNATCEPFPESEPPYRCHCPPEYDGTVCDISVSCPAETTVSLKGLFDWPETAIHHNATLTCPTGDGVAYRSCLFNNGEIAWTPEVTTMCADTELTSEIAGTFTSQLATNTERASDMKAEELESVVELLSHVVVYSFTNLSIAKDMMRCVSNVLDVDAEVMARSTSDENTSGEILSIIKDFGENVVLENTSSVEFRETNMQIQIVEPQLDDVTDGIAFEESERNGTTMFISLPAELFHTDQDGDETDNNERRKHRIRFTSLQNGKLFLSDSNLDGESLFDADNQKVISAELTGRKISGLSQTVNYSIEIPQAGGNYNCVYWDESGGFWSYEGLQRIRYTDGNSSIECTSTHLTYFAVLLDTGLSDVVPEQHTVPLTIISYVGSAISMLGLIATFLTYTLFRSLRKQPSGKLLVNLCVSLFCLNLIFILDGTGALTGTEGTCKLAAILLHYFVLTTFLWMGAEAVSIYRSLVEVFQGNRSSYYVCKCAIVAWGGGLIPVGIVMAIDLDLYTTHPAADICILSQENTLVYYLLYLAPCTLVLVANMIVFVLVLRAVFACNKQVHHNSARLRRTQVGCALSITFLLGLTWLFGLFAISEATLPFQYVFCILNSMQGFFIFMFRCALYPEALRSWRMCIKMRTLSVDRHINSSNAQKHSSHNHPSHSSSSSTSKKSSKSKQTTKVTFASSESNKTSFRWLRRSDAKDLACINNEPCEEKYIPTESFDEGRNNNALSIEYPFRPGYNEENSV